MTQHENNLPSFPQSYTQDKMTINTHQLKIMNRNNYDKSQAPLNTTSLRHVLDPRFDQLLSRHFSKVAPYRNDVNLQKMSKQSIEASTSHLKPSSDVSSNSINTPLNRTSSPLVSKSTKANFISEATRKVQNTCKEKHDRTMAYAYMLICSLCIALIVVPTALLFGLPKEHIATTVNTPTSTTTSTTTTTSATTTTTAMTTTSTTVTTTTTTEPLMVAIMQVGDTIVGVYDTKQGGSTGGSNGNYPIQNQMPEQAIDGVLGTKYVNFGLNGSLGYVRPQSGVNTGFYVTPAISSRSVARAILFATASDYPERDPLEITLEGTNLTGTGALDLGSSWTLIYTGPTGINPVNNPGRLVYGSQQNFSNSIAYSSYRLLVTLQRNDSDCVQYAEVQIIGYI